MRSQRTLRASPPPQRARPVPHGRPVDHPWSRVGVSRVACASLVYMLPPLPRCSGWAYSSLISPSRVSLPRKGHRVGLHIVLFEACSAFTRVAACTLARSPIRDPLSEGFRHFVSSMPAPVASGWSESPGGACTHWKAPPYHGAPPKRSCPTARTSKLLGRDLILTPAPVAGSPGAPV